eukprot:bmy_11350T0
MEVLPQMFEERGCPVTKTKVIFKVEQGQEPWMVEGENPHWRSPEVICLLDDELEGQEGEGSKDNFLNQGNRFRDISGLFGNFQGDDDKDVNESDFLNIHQI